ncbi:MAG: hypothetical protein H7Z39_11885 [Burkholderiaceae bacterium]|nr:hypothetical protein [Burkholderiaceae bacterium]
MNRKIVVLSPVAGLMRVVAKAALGVALLSGASACSRNDTAVWIEEVESRDGSVFQLEGKGERGASGFPFAHRGGIGYQSYYHRLSKAYWKAPAPYYPEVFDLVDGVPYVVVALRGNMLCHLLDYPANSLLVFRWTDKAGWERAPSDVLPHGLHLNILSEVFSERDKARDVRGFVSLQSKNPYGVKETLADSIRKGGDLCEKLRGGSIKTDYVVPRLTGFHGRPPQ